MLTIALKAAADTETETLVALMEDALTSEPTRRAMLADTSLTSYTAYQDAEVVGGVVVRWGDDSEIELLAVNVARRGRGLAGRLSPK